MIPVPSDAKIALYPLYAEDTFDRAKLEDSGEALASPTPDLRLSPDWVVHGTLVAQDRVFGVAQTAFYGWLLESANEPGKFMAVIRGTCDIREWVLDAEFVGRRAHPVAGSVESGFWSIYETMRYRPSSGGDLPVAAGIAATVGNGTLLVTGHSLGSALAEFLSFELGELLHSRLEMIVFASPRPGDEAFGAAFNFIVPAHRAYFWDADLVPKVPFGFGYAPIPQSIELKPPANLKICGSLVCAHHVLTYAGMLDESVLKSLTPTPQDERYLKCLTVSARPT